MKLMQSFQPINKQTRKRQSHDEWQERNDSDSVHLSANRKLLCAVTPVLDNEVSVCNILII
jgi:hypothetical protein